MTEMPKRELSAMVERSRAIVDARLAKNAVSAVAPMTVLPGMPIVGVRMSSLIPQIIANASKPYVETPFPTLNKRLGGGLELHSITVIVAGSGKGKSSLALQLAAHHAEHAPVVDYAGEMLPMRRAARIIGQRTQRSWSEVLHAGLSEAEMHAVLGPLHIYGVARQANPIAAIGKTLELAIAETRAMGITGTPMIVIDYVQLLADAAKDQRLSIMEQTRKLGEIAEAVDVVVVLLSQTSRGGAATMREGTDTAEEMTGMGAETSELEKTATNELNLAYTQQDGAEVHNVTLVISKARDKGPSKMGMLYNGRTGVWSESETMSLAKGERARREAILCQIDLHNQKKCNGGMGGCLGMLTGNAFAANGVHKVSGHRDVVYRSLKAMVAEGVLKLDGNVYYTPSAPAT